MTNQEILGGPRTSFVPKTSFVVPSLPPRGPLGSGSAWPGTKPSLALDAPRRGLRVHEAGPYRAVGPCRGPWQGQGKVP